MDGWIYGFFLFLSGQWAGNLAAKLGLNLPSVSQQPVHTGTLVLQLQGNTRSRLFKRELHKRGLCCRA